MADSEPYYVYKLIPSTLPVREPIPERLPVSEIDRKSGFIHLSTAFQVPNTLKHFFENEPFVYTLRIEYQSVEQDIRWESPDGDVCGPRPEEGLFPVSFLFSVCITSALFPNVLMATCSTCTTDLSWEGPTWRVLPCGGTKMVGTKRSSRLGHGFCTSDHQRYITFTAV